MSTEENLGPASGSGFDPLSFSCELAMLISGESNALGVDNPELKLLACRCVNNLIEALPTYATFVALKESRVISALSATLQNLEYVDVAEQAVTTLERISRERSKDILEEGIVDSLLSYLDFFALNVQRNAVQCVANSLQQVSLAQLESCSKFIVRL
jgi:E3 ubiquitin-protein ligase TRIP12